MQFEMRVQRIFVTVILILTLIPMAGQVLSFSKATDVTSEKRTLTQFPTVEKLYEKPTEFTSNVSSYLNDHFAGRGFTIKYYNKFKRKIDEGNQQVLVGQNDWLFLNFSTSWSNFVGREALSFEEVRKWNQTLQSFRRISESHDIFFLATYAPNKNQIYPEFAPKRFGQKSESRLVTDLDWDLKLDPALLSGKSFAPMFYKTDTHWTRSAAYLAYREITDAFIRNGLDVYQLDKRNLSKVERTDFQGDLVAMIDASSTGIAESITEFSAPAISPKPKLTVIKSESGDPSFNSQIYERSPKNGNSIVIIGDSFSYALLPYFNHSFDRVIFIHNEIGEFKFESALKYDPDAILFIPVERYASLLLNYE